MSLPLPTQAKYWGITALVIFALLWLLGDILMPFLLGAALAYFLDPVADRLQRLGLSRVMSTSIIALVACLAFVALIVAILPKMITQMIALIEAAPSYLDQAQAALLSYFPQLADSASSLRKMLASATESLSAQGANLANGLLSTAFGAVSAVVMALIVPVVAFYLLLDWDRMIAQIDKLLPRQHADTIRQIARDIDETLAGFVRGQVLVCAILGTFYSIALMLAGLNFGLLVGAVAGAVTFIPYVGALLGGALAIGLALFQFWGDWFSIGLIAAIFAIGQFLEGNVLTPKLVGQSVGLHPVWLMFALTAFGSLFGFVGMLVAVPLAAVIGVLVRFGLGRYQSSTLFTGEAPKKRPRKSEDAS